MNQPMPEAKEPSEIAKLAAQIPPKSFRAFSLKPVPFPEAWDKGSVNWVDFEVRCPRCGHDQFHVGCYPIVAPDPSPYRRIAPGETIRRPPHRLRCAACGATDVIFDVRKDGYDGILCGGGAYQSGAEGETFTDHAYRVLAAASYNIDISELEQLAAEAGSGVRAPDLFDWFNLIATPVIAGEPLDLGYECA